MSETKQEAAAEPLKVNIFSQPYHLRTDGDAEYVRQLARFVDERMQAISSHTSIVDYAKVAVLAALNIADELHRLKLQAEEAAVAAGSGPTAVSGQASDSASEEAASAPDASEAAGREKGGDSWSYSDIFESLPSTKDSLPKMGHNITSRLRQLRRETGSSGPEPEAGE